MDTKLCVHIPSSFTTEVILFSVMQFYNISSHFTKISTLILRLSPVKNIYRVKEYL